MTVIHLLTRPSLIVGLCLSLAGPLCAEDRNALGWLDQMGVAVERLSYRGTLIQVQGQKIEAFEVIRRVDDTGVHERIFALNGPAREMVRRGDRTEPDFDERPTSWIPSVIQPSLMLHQTPHQWSELTDAYEIELGGRERVAGYTAQRVNIHPKDAYRYGQRLWLEVETGMLLKSVIVDGAGNRLGEQGFVTIELDATISDQDLQPVAPALSVSMPHPHPVIDRPRRRGSRTAGRVVRPLWGPKELPAFFYLINAHHGRSDQDSAFDHLLFSDGLTSFSVYIDHSPDRVVNSRLEAMGPMHIFTAMRGQRQFTIMGQVPEATVEFVARQFLAPDEK